jgi:hypothetical protein
MVGALSDKAEEVRPRPRKLSAFTRIVPHSDPSPAGAERTRSQLRTQERLLSTVPDAIHVIDPDLFGERFGVEKLPGLREQCDSVWNGQSTPSS